MRIPGHVAYRIYGESLAIVMNVRTRVTLLLQHRALALWRHLAVHGDRPAEPGDRPILERFAGLGMLETGQAPSGVTSSASATSSNEAPAPVVNMGVVNYWAFKNRIPISGHFELTNRCNLRCRHCYCLFDHKRETLATKDVTRIIDELKRCGTLGLVLTGGEIFMREDIMDILRHLAERRFVVRLNTNGTLLTEQHIANLASYSNVYRVHVSLYGARAEVHDAITQSTGSFDKTLRSIRRMREAGIRLRVNCSVLRSNLDDVPRIHDLICEGLGIPVRFDPFIFPRDDGSSSNTSDALDDAQHQQLLEFMRRRGATQEARQGAGRDDTHAIVDDEAMGEPSEPTKPKLCKAGFAFFSICEDGRVYPCLKMKRFYANPLGDLRAQGFGDIWERSAVILRIREALDGKLRKCDICSLRV